jgi:hypothetical protein
MPPLRQRSWFKVVFYTTPLALAGAAGVALLTTGIPEGMGWRYFASVAACHLAIWLPSIPAFRRAPELSSLIWGIFSPVVGLALFSILLWPFTWGAWVFGAIALIFSYGLPIAVSVLCTVALYQITQNDIRRSLRYRNAEQAVPPNA